MRYFRLGIGVTMLAMFLAGCGGPSEGTTMPTGPVTTPPEIELMKNDMQKRLQQFNRFGHKSHQKSPGARS